MDEVGQVRENDRLIDRSVMMKMERYAEFLVHMIEKYGWEVLAEIEAEESAEKEDGE